MLLAEPTPTRADWGLRVAGFPVRVTPWFWLVGLGLGWHKGVTLETLVWWLLVSFVAILVHELGHALTARWFGATNGRIVLYHLGGLAISEGRLPRWQRVVELLMGPGAGFLLGGAAFLAWYLLRDTLRPEASLAFIQLIFVCVVWGAVNLLPVYPLDGGQVSLEVSTRFGPRGPLWALRGSFVTALVVSIVFFGLFFTGAGWGLFSGLLFLSLALQNWIILRAVAQGGGPPGAGDGLMPHERQPWERDPDYWRGR